LDAGFGNAAAVDDVLLGAFSGVAVAEGTLGSDNATGSAGATVAVDGVGFVVAAAVDGVLL
jgi:hypothetical protein